MARSTVQQSSSGSGSSGGDGDGGTSVARTLATLLLIVAASSLCLLPLLPSPAAAGQLSPMVNLYPRHANLDDPRDLLKRTQSRQDPPRRVKRAASGAVQTAIAALSQSNPFLAATEADAQPDIKEYTAGSDASTYSYTADTGDSSQLPWNVNVYFQPSAATNGSADEGWQELPQTPGFILNRSTSIFNTDKTGSGIMPFYITENTNTPETVKRAIIVWPGKPRDAWNYANLMLNARSVVVENFASWGITNDSVLILAPVFMAAQDMTAGGGHPGEFSFGGELWQAGSHTQQPVLEPSLTSYEILDFFTDMLADQAQYPNLNQIVVAGHSLGGQAAQRYAVLKKSKNYDYNVRFWVGNPGSWAWLTSDFPYTNSSCPIGDTTASPTSWPYGLNGNQTELTSYARADVKADQAFVIQRYLQRKVSYSLALLDDGPGSTSCSAQWQGANHLDRGSQFILNFQNNTYTNNAFPGNHTVDFIANISHQDYPMYSSNVSLQRLFYDDFDVRYPDDANATNPSDSSGKKAYATPAHEKVALTLLLGSVVLVIICFTTLTFTFTPNYDASWEKTMSMPAGQVVSRIR